MSSSTHFIQRGGAGYQAPPILSREWRLDVKLHQFYPERGHWMSSSTHFIQRGAAGCQAPPITVLEGGTLDIVYLLNLLSRGICSRV